MGNFNCRESENHLPMSVFFFSDFLMTTVAEKELPTSDLGRRTSDFGLCTIEDLISLSQSTQLHHLRSRIVCQNTRLVMRRNRFDDQDILSHTSCESEIAGSFDQR